MKLYCRPNVLLHRTMSFNLQQRQQTGLVGRSFLLHRLQLSLKSVVPSTIDNSFLLSGNSRRWYCVQTNLKSWYAERRRMSTRLNWIHILPYHPLANCFISLFFDECLGLGLGQPTVASHKSCLTRKQPEIDSFCMPKIVPNRSVKIRTCPEVLPLKYYRCVLKQLPANFVPKQ